MASGAWRKSPPELVERFDAAIAGIDGLERRMMFGYPAAFVRGHLTTSLFADSWVVRLPEDQRRELTEAGWASFEPMQGRPMRGYLLLPNEVAADEARAREWVERAAEYVRALPPKARKPRRATKG
jgi:TfoX/Sxy family transcriptional regulator of competence genes